MPLSYNTIFSKPTLLSNVILFIPVITLYEYDALLKLIPLPALSNPILVNNVVVTVPVNVGEAKLDFKVNAVVVASDIGFDKSVVLLTFDKPTIALVILFVVPVKVAPPDAIDNIAVVDAPPI